MQTHSSHTKHLHIMTYGKLVVLPGAAGLPGCCRGAAGVLPGAAGRCRVLPGCRGAGVQGYGFQGLGFRV